MSNLLPFSLMVYSQYTGTDRNPYKHQNGKGTVQCRNIQNDPRQGQRPEPIASYCTVLFPVQGGDTENGPGTIGNNGSWYLSLSFFSVNISS